MRVVGQYLNKTRKQRESKNIGKGFTKPYKEYVNKEIMDLSKK